ncbi:MAG TPA: ATP-binding cassette domain-containing protein [Baekduia sp.]|uniref:ATP-binding cassette domain-containing protein n=1 Tax=Baekduia sp. TaxID=2600305 RepID=UPI002B592377|nr:ATP-binding cassette domain-containing protein [Baekduia sp.]HMJ36268.1 ATP-binding cassette domain-containing protein [Baekduia sp.]
MTALLKLEAVSVSYWRGRRRVQVLRDVSFELDAGEFGGVWADRSAGKTTLAKIAAGVLAPDEGRVTFDGHDSRQPDRRGMVHGQIGFATRRGPELESMAVEAWIASTMLNSFSWRAAIERTQLALDRVGAAEAAAEPWSELSDGERGLVAIAQAIVRGPKLVVVDDPVAGLGGARRSKIISLLRSIAAEGVAVLMTAAELTELQGADRIWSLEAGRLDGPPARSMGTVVPFRNASGS